MSVLILTPSSTERKDEAGGQERNLEMIEFNFRLHLYKAKVRLLQVGACGAPHPSHAVL